MRVRQGRAKLNLSHIDPPNSCHNDNVECQMAEDALRDIALRMVRQRDLLKDALQLTDERYRHEQQENARLKAEVDLITETNRNNVANWQLQCDDLKAKVERLSTPEDAQVKR